MAQTTKAIREAYNAKAYKQHSFRVRRDSDLNARIEQYKVDGHSLNHLLTMLLCKHFEEPFPHPEMDNA